MGEGDPEWARELRRQLVREIELAGRGLGKAGDGPAEDAADRIYDLRQRLAQVERLISAIEGPGDDADFGDMDVGALDGEATPSGAQARRSVL